MFPDTFAKPVTVVFPAANVLLNVVAPATDKVLANAVALNTSNVLLKSTAPFA